MDLCLYCGQSEAIDSEHILQDSFGSDYEKNGILCHECNILFGSTIDNYLAKSFEILRFFWLIKNKRNKYLYVTGVDSRGREAYFNPITGNVSVVKTESVDKVFDDDGNIRMLKITSSPENFGKSIEDAKKFARRKKLCLSEPIISGYDTESAYPISYRFKFSECTYIALRKSLLNFISQNINDKKFIKDKCIAIRKFCLLYRESPAVAYSKTKELEIDGYPYRTNFDNIIENTDIDKDDRAHVLCCYSKDGIIYGISYLFGAFPWAFKITEGYTGKDILLIRCFNPYTRKSKMIDADNYGIKSSDITTLKIGREYLQDTIGKEVNKAMGEAPQNIVEAIKSYYDTEQIKQIFPIKVRARGAVFLMLQERAISILKLVYSKDGIDPLFFETAAIKILISTLVDEFLRNIPNDTIDEENYRKFISWVIEISLNEASFNSIINTLHFDMLNKE